MGRSLKIIFFLLILTALASPYAAGFLIQKNYYKLIDDLNNKYQSKVQFTGNFNRGYLTSTATTNISFGPETIVLSHKVLHGPLFLDITSPLKTSSYVPKGHGLGMMYTKFTGNIEQSINSLYKDQDAYLVTTTFDFHGNSKTLVKNYPLTTTMGAAQLNWQGLDYTIDIQQNIVNQNINIPMIQYSETDKNTNLSQMLQIAGIVIDLNLNVSNGNTKMLNNFSIDNVKIMGNKTNEFSIDKLSYTVNFQEENNLINLDLQSSMNLLDFDDQKFGPFTMDLQLDNLDASVVGQLETKAQQLKQAEVNTNNNTNNTNQNQMPQTDSNKPNAQIAPKATSGSQTTMLGVNKPNNAQSNAATTVNNPGQMPAAKTDQANSAAIQAQMANAAVANKSKINVNITPDQMQQLLSKQPKLTLNSKFTTPQGDISLTGHTVAGGANLQKVDQQSVLATLDADWKFQITDKILFIILSNYAVGEIRNLERQYFILNKTSNKVNPYTMNAKQLDAAVTQWVTSVISQLKLNKIFTEENNTYSIAINYTKNTLTINGVVQDQTAMNKIKAILATPIPTVSSLPASLNNMPATPATPATPASPATPTAPATPASPAAPTTPATPTAPTTPVTPAPSASPPAPNADTNTKK
jgi:uncharacterized protein YdgA (DUF945 family)